MSDARKCWKQLFLLLFNNQERDGDLPRMWTQFKEGNLQRSDIEAAIESVKDDIQENEREVLDRICSAENVSDSDTASVVRLMKECDQLEDDTWRLMLFTSIRDRATGLISTDTKVPIFVGGQTRLMTLQDIETNLIQEEPDIFKSQRSVPDQMVHEDLMDAQFNTQYARENLKELYEDNLSKAKQSLTKKSLATKTKLKPDEVERQAAAQAKTETKQSKEAQLLKYRVAMMAENNVQKSIERVMKEYGIPALVLRGVNTYKDIAKFLESFGIEVSRLKAFKCRDSKCSLECEHDIVTLALLPTGPLVSFNQVIPNIPWGVKNNMVLHTLYSNTRGIPGGGEGGIHN